MAVQLKSLLFPNITTQQAVSGKGLNPIASSLILIDNKEYNNAAIELGASDYSKDVPNRYNRNKKLLELKMNNFGL